MYKQYKPYQVFLIIADAAFTIIVFIAMIQLRPFLPGRFIHPEDMLVEPSVYLAAAALWVTLGGFAGVYDLARLPFFGKQLGRITFAHLMATLVFAGFLYFSYREVSRMLVVYFALVNYLALLFTRYGLTRFLRSKRSHVRRTNVLIVGTSDTATSLARAIVDQLSSVYHIVGFVDDRSNLPSCLAGLCMGAIEDIPRLVRDNEVELVLIALANGEPHAAEKLVQELYPMPVRIYVVPDLLSLTFLNSEVDSVADIPVIGIREPLVHGTQWVIKRTLDLAVASVLLLVTWPLFLVIAIAIKLESSGPVIYAPERDGANGKVFKMLKFRSMIVGADKLQEQVVETDAKGKPVFKTIRDPRITRVGRWLRRTSLDELPQLINVLKGEMSLVGPRPEQPFITKTYESWQWMRLAVPPGITGLWQVSGRSDLPMHLNTRLDIHYARNFSLFLDLKILLKTILVVIRGKGAY